MAETLLLDQTATKAEKYETLLPQIQALTLGETDLVANLANIAAALKQGFGFFWVGFYLDRGKELVLGPFQGTIACSRIAHQAGVCGAAYSTRKTIIVADVDKFDGHIACSSDSKSEIVVPVFKDGKVVMVLDVDSETLNHFDETDKVYLEKLADFMGKNLL